MFCKIVSSFIRLERILSFLGGILDFGLYGPRYWDEDVYIYVYTTASESSTSAECGVEGDVGEEIEENTTQSVSSAGENGLLSVFREGQRYNCL